MARIDYFDIELELKDILESASLLSEGVNAPTILIEEDLAFQRGDIIQILLSRRDAPDELQTLSASGRTRYLLTISIWCYGFALTRRDAMRKRDDLVGKVEIVLQSNRTLNDKVGSSWFGGGDFENRRESPEEDAFLSGAEIELVCDVSAVS
jgi:hypothetical protein